VSAGVGLGSDSILQGDLSFLVPLRWVSLGGVVTGGSRHKYLGGVIGTSPLGSDRGYITLAGEIGRHELSGPNRTHFAFLVWEKQESTSTALPYVGTLIRGVINLGGAGGAFAFGALRGRFDLGRSSVMVRTESCALLLCDEVVEQRRVGGASATLTVGLGLRL
jgi:hypothetical protein